MTRNNPRFVFQYFRIKSIILLFFLSHFSSIIIAQELPLGYISYYSDKCTDKNFFKTWDTDAPEGWNIISLKNEQVLRGTSADSLDISNFPGTRGILSNLIFGDFILEFEFKTSSKQNSDSSGFYFLGPMKTSQIYYAFAFTSDSIKFYLIANDITKMIAAKPVLLNEGGWNIVRIRRDILTRKLHIIMNNKSEEIAFTDRKLVMGYIGFGIHDATSYLKNINVWAPTVIVDTSFIWQNGL